MALPSAVPGQASRTFPFCGACVTHIQRTPQTSPLVVAAAALATCGVYLVIDYLRRQQASSAMLPSCSAVDYPILPLRSASGAEGLEFRCEAFARELLVLNGGGQPAAALTSQSVSPLSRPLPAHVPSQPWRATPPTPPPAPAVRLAPIPPRSRALAPDKHARWDRADSSAPRGACRASPHRGRTPTSADSSGGSRPATPRTTRCAAGIARISRRVVGRGRCRRSGWESASRSDDLHRVR